MGQYTYQKRRFDAVRPSPAFSREEGLHRSNSAMSGMLGVDGPAAGERSALYDSILQRFPGERNQAQIPVAEAEADRLSAPVTSGSPEEVKAAMGRRLGADFSGVRFHIGIAAEARAKAVSARAYTSGNDVYFGEGGFDPAVAAHELVHTAQQGAVEAAAPTVAAPLGGIQCKKDKKKAAKVSPEPEALEREPEIVDVYPDQHHDEPAPAVKEKKGIRARLAGMVDKAKDHTVGAISRALHGQSDEYLAAHENGDWENMSRFQRGVWRLQNLPGVLAAQRSSVKAASQERAEEREKFRDMGRNMLEEIRAKEGKALTLIPDQAPDGETLPEGADPETYVQPMRVGQAPEGGWKKLLPEPVRESMTAAEKLGEGNIRSALHHEAKALGGMTEKALSAAEGAGALPMTPPIMDAASLTENAVKMVQGQIQASRMEKLMEKGTGGLSREELVELGDKDRLLYRDIAHQAYRTGQINRNEATGHAVADLMKLGGAAASAAGPGAPLGMVLTAAGKATDVVTDQVIKHQRKSQQDDVVEETLGFNREKAADFLRRSGLEVNEENLRKLREGLIRASGYETGSRSEVYADQTQKRADVISEQSGQSELYNRMAQGLSSKQKNGEYDSDKIRKKLGGGKGESREEVVGRKNEIASKAHAKQQERVQKEQKLMEAVKQREMDLKVASAQTNPADKKETKRIEKAKKKAQIALDEAKEKLRKRQEKNRSHGLPVPAV